MRILQAEIISSVGIFSLQSLFSDVVVECLGQCGREGDLEVVESFAIFGSKLSLSEYGTHVAALDVVDQLSAEELGDRGPSVARGGDRALERLEEEAAELLHVLLDLRLLLGPAERSDQLLGGDRFLLGKHAVEEQLKRGWEFLLLSDLGREDESSECLVGYLNSARWNSICR